MTVAVRRGTAGALLAALLAAGGYVMLADFINLRQAEALDRPITPDQLALPQPWGGYAWRRLARVAGDAAVLAPDTARRALLEAAERYPLDAVQWLDLARIHARAGNAAAVDAALLRANAVQPFQRRALWAAAQVALQTGNAELAERQLRRWLRLYPGDTGQALFIGRRWIDSPGALLDRMLPEGREFLAEAMKVARRQSDPALAEAVWQRLDPAPEMDDPLFLNFAELLLATGQVERAAELWAGRDPAYAVGGVANGSFSRPPGEPLGLNWRLQRAPAGVRVARDTDQASSPPASLRVEFNGRENIHLGVPWIRIPVQPGQHYRLSGTWRADGLTTRSLPYLNLRAEGGGLRERLEVPGDDFDWRPWSIEFQAPADAQLIRLQLRRNRTNAFDRNIGGRLWLDDVRLEVVPAPAAPLETPVYGLRFTAYGGNPERAARLAGAGADGGSGGLGVRPDRGAEAAPTGVDGSSAELGRVSTNNQPTTNQRTTNEKPITPNPPARKPSTVNRQPAPEAP